MGSGEKKKKKVITMGANGYSGVLRQYLEPTVNQQFVEHVNQVKIQFLLSDLSDQAQC